ncbi:MAG: exonuclease domain-containing protein, partial [Solirubrobacterales bacterium]
LDLREAGRYARLDLSWDGRPLDAETLRAWSEEPLDAEGSGIPSNVNAVVERHGGEVWAQAEPDERARVRLLLPAAEAAHSGRPEAARRTQAAVESRPEFYDFDLFRAAERGSGWDKRGLDELAYTVFDTETTGLQPSSDEIISIGAVRVVNGRLLRQETFDQLVDPRREVSPLSVRIHGIEAELLRGQPTIEEVLPLFARFCEDTVLVGHNVGFDLRFLELKEEVTSVRLAQPVLDTLLLDAVAEPDEEDHSLEAMSARLGISAIGRHTALGDAILTGEIFLAQLRLLAAQGIRTLDEAREAAHSTYLARVSESLYSGA